MSFLCCCRPKTETFKTSNDCFYSPQDEKEDELLSLFQNAIYQMNRFSQNNKDEIFILVDSKKGEIQGFNKRLSSIFGHTIQTVLGQSISTFLGQDKHPLPNILDEKCKKELKKSHSFKASPVDLQNIKDNSKVSCAMFIENIDTQEHSTSRSYASTNSTAYLESLLTGHSKITIDSTDNPEEVQPYFFIRLIPDQI